MQIGINPPQQSQQERHARNVLQYLRERGHAEQLFQFLISEEYGNATFRPIALRFYYENYRDSLMSSIQYNESNVARSRRIQQETSSHMSNTKLSTQIKRAVALGASIAFAHKSQREKNPTVARSAAKFFWAGFNLTAGEVPKENSIEAYVYKNTIAYESKKRPSARAEGFQLAELASQSLRNTILNLNFESLRIDNIGSLLYAYAEITTVADSPTYLVPADTVAVVQRILKWADTDEKRIALSGELGSIGGDWLFRNLLPNCPHCSTVMAESEVEKRCTAAEEFGEMLSSWYMEHHAEDWNIPKFFYSVVYEFPELGDRVEGEKWGVGLPVEKTRGICVGKSRG